MKKILVFLVAVTIIASLFMAFSPGEEKPQEYCILQYSLGSGLQAYFPDGTTEDLRKSSLKSFTGDLLWCINELSKRGWIFHSSEEGYWYFVKR